MEFDKFMSKVDEICYPKGMVFQDDKKDFSIKQLNDLGKPFKTKIACVELYPECLNHYAALHKLSVMGQTSNLPFAMILHNMDLLPIDIPEEERFKSSYDGIHKKPHIHVVIKFRNQRYNTGVAKELGISSNYVKMWADSLFSNRIAYLLHCDNFEKYQYPVDFITGTLTPLVPDILNEYAVPPLDMFKFCADFIQRYDKDKFITRSKLQDYMLEHGFSSIIRSAFYRLLCERVDDHNYLVKAKIDKGDI